MMIMMKPQYMLAIAETKTMTIEYSYGKVRKTRTVRVRRTTRQVPWTRNAANIVCHKQVDVAEKDKA